MSPTEERNTQAWGEAFSGDFATGVDTAEFPVTSEMITAARGDLDADDDAIAWAYRSMCAAAVHSNFFNAEIPVTPEMIAAASFDRIKSTMPANVYRAMRAVAPDCPKAPEAVVTVYAIERATHLRQIKELEVERDDARAMLRMRETELRDAQEIINRLKREAVWVDSRQIAVINKLGAENLNLRKANKEYRAREGGVEQGARQAEGINRLAEENAALQRRFGMVSAEPGCHDYHGPLGAPDDKGQRRAVPDPDHERFHQSVGDVLAGRIIPAAREQMAEALRRKVPDAPTSASTSKPMPDPAFASFGDPRRIGG
jgi:hypothetical protein